MASSFDTELETPDMENLAAVAENLVYLLPGCSDVMIRKAIQEVYRDFCRRSCCLRVRRQFTLAAGQASFRAGTKYGGVVDCVSVICYNGRKLASPCDYIVSDGEVPTVTLAARLVPNADADAATLPTIDMTLVEMPRVCSEEIPSWFMGKYGDVIKSGVCARLMIMNGRPWTDTATAQVERIAYENAVCEARMRFYDGGTNGSGSGGIAVNAEGLL